MILLSNGGTNIQRANKPSDTMAVGTVDGVALLERTDKGWQAVRRELAGCNVSALTALDDGTLFAATHGIGIARSTDGGNSWTWCNEGLTHIDFWAARAGKLQGREVVLAGTLPAHLFISEDRGGHWRELPALRDVKSVSQWCFPPAPRIGHVKEIVIDDDKIYVGIEIGALLVSDDCGKTFRELPVDPDPRECDIHRIMVHPKRPKRIITCNGIVGLMTSEDGGASWRKNDMPPDVNYPDPIVVHPDDPDLVFVTGASGWPPNWYKRGRACGTIARSRDGGKTWQRLLGGLPDGQRAVFGALTIEAWDGGYALYAADTDGQIFESRDGGERWTIVADVPPVSKGEFYKALVRERGRLANIDDLSFTEAATKRVAAAQG